MTGVELVDAAVVPGSGGGLLVIVDVGYRGGGAERYLLPARLVEGDLDEVEPNDPLWERLVSVLTGGGALAGLEGSFVTRCSGEIPAVARSDGRQLEPDQSNTSILLGGTHVLKCYRRLEGGIHPEPELLEALGAVGSRVAPAWVATLTHRHRDRETALAVLYRFVPGDAVGWEPVVEGYRAALAPDGSAATLLEDAATLGATAAELHRSLATTFGITIGDADAAGRAELRARSQLDAAFAALPGEVAVELDPFRQPAMERLRALAGLEGAPLTRLHGDLHLAQFVRAPTGLVAVDFEGEPDRPLAERRMVDSPLRDLACLLLSFDHAAVAAAQRCGFGEATERAFAWSGHAREQAIAGYRRGVAGSPIEVDLKLLGALEVEKECRELLYAARMLPEWLYAPRLTFPRLFEPVPKRDPRG